MENLNHAFGEPRQFRVRFQTRLFSFHPSAHSFVRQMILSDALLQRLRPFLSQKLEPICDADPEVLSEYVLALLKHDLPTDQLQEKCKIQLGDFLREHTS